jgi:hypothetical protein
MIGAIGLAVISPAVLLFFPSLTKAMAVLGGLWTLLSQLVLAGIESQKKKQAATVQEQFDLSLFGIPWNNTLVGNRLSPELIHAADRKFKGNREDLRDWYADTENVPSLMDVLLCQRSNLVWDWRLRRGYGWIVTVLTAAVFGVGVLLALSTNKTVADYILGLFIPSLSAYLQGIEVAKRHFRTVIEQEQLERQVSCLWDSGLQNTTIVTLNQVRCIQDCIFNFRSKGPLLPDFWYKLLRGKYQLDMGAAVREFRDRVGHQ